MIRLLLRAPRVVCLLAILSSASVLGACRSADRTAPLAEPGPSIAIHHLVFFTLADPSEAPALIADCNALVPSIPGVRGYFAGRHIDSGREAVDQAYDAAMHVGFTSLADYRVYEDHPNHLELVRLWRPRLRSLLIRDVGNE